MTLGDVGSTETGGSSLTRTPGTAGNAQTGRSNTQVPGAQGTSSGGGTGSGPPPVPPGGNQTGGAQPERHREPGNSGLPLNLEEFHRRCLAIVDEYRSSGRSHDTAFVQLHKYVFACPPALGNLFTAFRDYAKMLDDHAQFLRGVEAERPPSPRLSPGAAGDTDETDAEAPPKRDKCKRKHSKRKPSRSRKSRSLDGSGSSSSGGEDSSDDDKGASHLKDFAKRRRAVERSDLAKGLPGGLFGFADASAIVEENLDPILRNTRRRYAAWKQDLTVSYEIVISSVDRPPLPDEHWKRILSGKEIDFEKLWADEISSRPGSSNPVAGTSSGTVRTDSDWSNVWGVYSDAVLFLMPDRKRELERYGRHMRLKFKTTKSEFHANVIAYDATVRKRVARQGNLMLSDFEEFSDIRDELLTSYGIGTGGNDKAAGKSKSAKRGKSSEICRNFNKGHCDQTDRKCNYRHVCSICNSLEHAAKQCPQAPKRE